MPSSAPMTDPYTILLSITKLQELNPEIILFSHVKASNRASEIIQRFKEDTRVCADVALKAYEAKEAKETHLSADDISRNIIAEMIAFRGKEWPENDLTFVVVKVV